MFGGHVSDGLRASRARRGLVMQHLIGLIGFISYAQGKGVDMLYPAANSRVEIFRVPGFQG